MSSGLEQHLPQVCPMLIPRAASDRLHAERLHPATTPVGVPGRSEELGDLGRHLAGPGWANTNGEMPSRRQAMDRLIERWQELRRVTARS